MKWLIVLHLMAASGYPIKYDVYPRSFQTKVECESHLKTKTYDRYVNRRYPPDSDFKTGRSYFYGECARSEYVR